MSVDGLTTEVTTLKVSADLAGQQRQFTITHNLAKFGLSLPPEGISQLTLSLTAHSEDGCLVGSGATTVQPSSDSLDFVRVVLTASDAAACHTLAAITRYGVVIKKAADGTGTVTSEPSGIECGARCQAAFSPGATVTLRARPDPQSYFVGWSGACTSSDDTCQVPIVDAASAGPRQVKAIFAHKLCSEGGWCWENPLPQGYTLNGVWAASATDAWAVGDMGTILHYDGDYWQRVASGTTASLRAVWGSGPRDVWMVGEGGVILRWDGATLRNFNRQALTTLNAIWGSGPDDVWIVGNGGVINHWTGAVLSSVVSPRLIDLNSVWGSRKDDVWLASSMGAVLRWDGAKVEVAREQVYASVVWGRRANDVWFLGLGASSRWNGTNFSVIPQGLAPINGIVGASGDVWAVRESGHVTRWTGTAFVDVPGAAPYALKSISATSAGDIFAVGTGGYLGRFDGSRLQPTSKHLAAATKFNAARGSAADDVWMVGSGGTVARWDGEALTRLSSNTRVNLSDVWASGSGDVWAVGDFGTVARWDGRSFITMEDFSTAPLQYRSLHAVWGSAARDVWVVGALGLVARWDGSQFASFENSIIDNRDVTGVCGSGPNEVWIIAMGDENRPCAVVTWDGGKFIDRGCPGQVGDIPGGSLHCAGFGDVWLGGSEVFRYHNGGFNRIATAAYVSGFHGVGEGPLLAAFPYQVRQLEGGSFTSIEGHILHYPDVHLGGSLAEPWLLGMVGGTMDALGLYQGGAGAIIRRHAR